MEKIPLMRKDFDNMDSENKKYTNNYTYRIRPNRRPGRLCKFVL